MYQKPTSIAITAGGALVLTMCPQQLELVNHIPRDSGGIARIESLCIFHQKWEKGVCAIEIAPVGVRVEPVSAVLVPGLKIC